MWISISQSQSMLHSRVVGHNENKQSKINGPSTPLPKNHNDLNKSPYSSRSQVCRLADSCNKAVRPYTKSVGGGAFAKNPTNSEVLQDLNPLPCGKNHPTDFPKAIWRLTDDKTMDFRLVSPVTPISPRNFKLWEKWREDRLKGIEQNFPALILLTTTYHHLIVKMANSSTMAQATAPSRSAICLCVEHGLQFDLCPACRRRNISTRGARSKVRLPNCLATWRNSR